MLNVLVYHEDELGSGTTGNGPNQLQSPRGRGGCHREGCYTTGVFEEMREGRLVTTVEIRRFRNKDV